MQTSDVIIIIICVLAAILVGLYLYNRKNMKKMMDAQDFIESNKMVAQIYVIDKKFERPNEHNLPKAIFEKLPKSSRIRKMAIVKAKVGPQIVTLTCDKNIYDALTTKKTVKIELSGIYIVNIVGLNLADKKKKTWREKITVYANNNKKQK